MSSVTEIPPLVLQITLVAVWLGVILAIAEGLNRIFSVNAEVSRKIVHIGTGNVILFAWWFNIPAWVGIAASVISGIIAIISYKTTILPSINSVGRKSLGTFFYAISIGVLIGWFWTIKQPQYAALGILVMTWGDGLAAVIGQNWGKHQYQFLGSSKSWEGSLTMLFVSFMISSIILLAVQGNSQLIWSISILVALVATGLETFSKYGIDNLTVPLSSASLAFFLNHIL
jgi:phytol kinase